MRHDLFAEPAVPASRDPGFDVGVHLDDIGTSMSDPGKEPNLSNRPGSSGRPSGPPQAKPRDARPQPGAPARTVYLLDRVLVRELAAAIGMKPFQVVSDLMELKQFKHADEEIDFGTASIIARKHGFRAEKPPPGVLIL